MTISFGIVTVVHSISQISVAGINMKDANQIPENAMMSLPCFYLAPEKAVTNGAVTRQSFGGGGTALMNSNYVLNYRYLHSVIGSGGGFLSVFPAMLANLALILQAIAANDNVTGAVDLEFAGITAIGAMTDPAGTAQYHGLEFALNVLEFIQ